MTKKVAAAIIESGLEYTFELKMMIVESILELNKKVLGNHKKEKAYSAGNKVWNLLMIAILTVIKFKEGTQCA